jgi:hypothetical protein
MTLLQIGVTPETVDYDARGVPGTAARRAWEAAFNWQIVGWPTCAIQWLDRRHRRDRSCCRGVPVEAYDHAYKVQRPDRSLRGVLVQPYHLDARKAAQLEEWCQRNGFAWRSIGAGFHHPAVIALVIYKPAN